MKAQKIQSDSGEGFYIVRLHHGHAVDCTCQGWKYRKDCKHLERAELAPAFRQAREYFLSRGMSEEKFLARYRATVERHGVTEAIRRTIASFDRLQAQCCRRCGGEGRIEAFSHIMGGICFRCWGRGVELSKEDYLAAKREMDRLDPDPIPVR